MFIAEMFTEAAGPQLVVFYPGRFQPFHLGHRDVFASLQAKFGRDNVFIATSNKVELPKSPFNFSEKTAFMNAAGVAGDRILQVTSPYKLPEQFDPANTIFVAAVGAPDADRLRPGATKKDGSPGYYQVFESVDKCATADKHGYVIVANEREFDIVLKGKKVDVSHGTPSRAAWNMVRDDAAGRSEYLTQMFGRNDPELGRILDKIPVNEDVNMDQTDSISPIHGHGVYETIRRVKGGYRLVSHTGKNLGTYPTRAGAEKRERQVQYFKHAGESVTEVFNTQAAGAWDNAPKSYGTEKFVFTASNGIQYRLDFLDPGIGPEEMGPESFDFHLGLDDAVFDKIIDRAKFVEFEQVNTKDPHGTGKQGIEGTGAAAEVFGSVVNAILTYIKKHKPSMLYFQAVEPNRRRLYTSMVNRLLKYLPGWGFERSGPADSMFAIYNTRLLKQTAVKEDAAGVGVVSNSKDPRYVMATAGDQNDVTAETLPKMMKAYGLIGKLSKHKVQEAEQLLSKISALQEQINQLKSKK